MKKWSYKALSVCMMLLLKFTLICFCSQFCVNGDDEARKIFTPAHDWPFAVNTIYTVALYERSESIEEHSLNSLNIQFTFSICLKKEAYSVSQMVLHCAANEIFEIFLISKAHWDGKVKSGDPSASGQSTTTTFLI